jgi:hypothetical protein
VFLHFVVFGKQVSLEAPDDRPLRETILKAFEFHKLPIGGDYNVRFESDQNEEATPSDLGIKEGTVVYVVAPDA